MFLALALPLLITSFQTAMLNPGLPFGFNDISPGYQRKAIQVSLIVFFPVTHLLLRLQHQITLKEMKNTLDMQHEYDTNKLSKLTLLLLQMEVHRKKMIKIDMAFENTNQMFFNILLVLFSISETRTETAFESLFNQEGKDDTFGISNLTIFMVSTVASFLSFLNLFTTAHASYWPWKSKMFVGVYCTMNLVLRLFTMILYFTPTLGLLNILRHYQAERLPFINDHAKYDFSKDHLYFGSADPVAWRDISHVNYSDPSSPTPPSSSLYTGLDSKIFFTIFISGWVFQIFCIWLHNFFISNIFRKFSIFDQIMHAFQSVITPFSSKDWADGEGNCKEHVKRMKIMDKEVVGTIKINAIFQFLHILPLAYLGNFQDN